MTKEINVEEAAKWDDKEADFNISYLEARLRFDEADKIREARKKKAAK